jgi:hypothetical protein
MPEGPGCCNRERIYFYFGGKAQLFEAALTRQLVTALEHLPVVGSGPEAIAEFAGKYFDFATGFPSRGPDTQHRCAIAFVGVTIGHKSGLRGTWIRARPSLHGKTSTAIKMVTWLLSEETRQFLVGLVNVECLGVQCVARQQSQPLPILLVIFVVGIVDRLDNVRPARGAPAVLCRCGTTASGAAR